jgi:radical SAM superfamily enzyme YgiQ (UPF0313 family)
MTLGWVEMIFKRIRHWRTELIVSSPYFAEKVLRERLAIDSSIQIKILGGFDSRIVYVVDTITSESYILSISKSLSETVFYDDYQHDILQITEFGCKLKSDSLFADTISSQFSVGLMSLAKPEVYTFPRFALGISDIAHALRNQFKSNVYLFDLQLTDTSEILTSLRNSTLDVIGISMTFGLFDVMKRIVNEVLAMKPNVKIIVGGSLAAIEYNEILNLFPNTIVSLGEGEKCMTKIIEWLSGTIKLSDIDDIAYVDDCGKTVTTKHEPIAQNMYLPELDLLIKTIHEKGVFQLETSRGCYNACSFCPRQHKGYWRPLVDDMKALDFFLKLYRDYLKLSNIDIARQTIYVVDEEFVGKDCSVNRNRAEQICSLFNKYDIRFEISFRMDAIFLLGSSHNENIDKIKNIMAIHKYGLNRVLVGVESGVDSILTRFNKHICSAENTQGIRLLTALGVPVRFTYITFDPLMSFDELIATYAYQGRTDLIIDPKKIGDVNSLFSEDFSEKCWKDASLGIPFYYFIPYMLVSLECLIGSKYYSDLEKSELLEASIITSLGKKSARFLDCRIGIMSMISQLWIDRNFSLDYTLKSLGKIYPAIKSEEIRTVRTKLKENAYRLLGKLIFFYNNDMSIINKQLGEEVNFMKDFCGIGLEPDKSILPIESIFKILDFQFSVLVTEIDTANLKLAKVLSKDDFSIYCKHYNNWKNSREWRLINE